MTMQPFSRAGIHSIAEYLPAEVASIGELHERGLLRGSPDTLRSFGFETVHLAGKESNIDMAVAAAERVLEESDIDRDEIGTDTKCVLDAPDRERERAAAVCEGDPKFWESFEDAAEHH